MYTQVASKLHVPTGTPCYSQAVSMEGGNAIGVELTVFNDGGGAGVTVAYEVSNDLENWDNGATLLSSIGVGYDYQSVSSPSMASRYVRLVYNAEEQDCIVAAGINVMNL